VNSIGAIRTGIRVARTAGLMVSVAVGFGTPSLRGDVITYKDGSPDPFLGTNYLGTQDTHLLTNPGGEDQNTGARTNIEFGSGAGGFNRHALMRFNITSFAGHFTSINSVQLKLYATGSNGANTLQMFRLADANTGWVEGTHTGNVSSPGESTWLQRVQGTTNWAGSQGASLAGTDYVSTLLGSQAYVSGLASGTPVTLTFADVSFISTWASGSNAGLFFRAQNEAPSSDTRIFAFSRNNGTASMNPELIIDFVPIPEPGSLTLCGIAAAGLFRFARSRRKPAA
jgi:hypothetical protein